MERRNLCPLFFILVGVFPEKQDKLPASGQTNASVLRSMSVSSSDCGKNAGNTIEPWRAGMASVVSIKSFVYGGLGLVMVCGCGALAMAESYCGKDSAIDFDGYFGLYSRGMARCGKMAFTVLNHLLSALFAGRDVLSDRCGRQ